MENLNHVFCPVSCGESSEHFINWVSANMTWAGAHNAIRSTASRVLRPPNDKDPLKHDKYLQVSNETNDFSNKSHICGAYEDLICIYPTTQWLTPILSSRHVFVLLLVHPRFSAEGFQEFTFLLFFPIKTKYVRTLFLACGVCSVSRLLKCKVCWKLCYHMCRKANKEKENIHLWVLLLFCTKAMDLMCLPGSSADLHSSLSSLSGLPVEPNHLKKNKVIFFQMCFFICFLFEFSKKTNKPRLINSASL